MPTYLHVCQNTECNNEWEDFYSIVKSPPTVCPVCRQDTAKRVICGTTKGVVELYGNELVEKCKDDAQKLKKEAAKDEKVYANLLGEEKYQSMQTRMDQQKRIRRSK
jgi:putative FmdB family regulatory protein